MPNRESKLTLRVTDDGSFAVFDQAGRRLGDLENKARQTTGQMGRGLDDVKSRAGALAASIAAAAAGFAAFQASRFSIGAAAEVEALQTRLVNLKGSAEAAEASYARFAGIAATTPFQLRNVVEAGVTLEAFGANADESLKSVADLAAFMGTDVTDAAQSFGRAFAAGAGAADVLRERGVLSLVSLRTGIQDLTKLSLPEFRKALITAMEDPTGPIAGATDRLADTWIGATSNIQDAVFSLGAEFGNLVIKSDAVGGSAVQLADQIRAVSDSVRIWRLENQELIDQDFASYIERVTGTVSTLGSAIGAIVGPLQEVGKFIEQLTGVRGSPFLVTDTIAESVNAARESLASNELLALNRVQGRSSSLAEVLGFADPGTNNLSNRVSRSRDQLADVQAFLEFNRPAQQTFAPDIVDLFEIDTSARREAPAPARPPSSPILDIEASTSRQKRAAQDTLEFQRAILGLEDTRLAIVQSRLALQQQDVEFARDSLGLARERGATDAQLLAIAADLDRQERDKLLAQQNVLDVQIEQAHAAGRSVAEVIKLSTELELVNRELERGPENVRRISDELRSANQVTVNLGQTLNQSLQRAADGLFARGGFNIPDLAADAGRAIGADLFGKVLEAAVNGGNLVVEEWGRTGDRLIDSSQGTAEGITGVFDRAFGAIVGLGSQAGNLISGLFGGGTGPPQSTQGDRLAGLGFSPDQAGLLQQGALAPAGGGVGGGGAGGFLGGAGGIGLGVATFGATAALQIALDANKAYNDLFDTITVQGLNINTINRGDILEAMDVLFGGAFGKNVAPLGNFLFDAFGIFQAPTTGTQFADAIKDVFDETLLPQQRVFRDNGSGVGANRLQLFPSLLEQEQARQLGFEQAANRIAIFSDQRPGIFEDIGPDLINGPATSLRFGEALGLGAILAPVFDAEGQITPVKNAINLSNRLTNSFNLLGISEEEALRHTRVLADTIGLDLLTGIEELNRKFIETQQRVGPDNDLFSIDNLAQFVDGLTEIFKEDIPEGLNVTAAAIANITESAGIDISSFFADLKEFTAALDIRDRVEDVRFGALSVREQEEFVRSEVDRVRTERADTTDRGDIQRLLQEEADLGLQLAGLAGERFAAGTTLQDRAIEEGLSIAEGAATQLEKFGSPSQQQPQPEGFDEVFQLLLATSRIENQKIKAKSDGGGFFDDIFGVIPGGDLIAGALNTALDTALDAGKLGLQFAEAGLDPGSVLKDWLDKGLSAGDIFADFARDTLQANGLTPDLIDQFTNQGLDRASGSRVLFLDDLALALADGFAAGIPRSVENVPQQQDFASELAEAGTSVPFDAAVSEELKASLDNLATEIAKGITANVKLSAEDGDTAEDVLNQLIGVLSPFLLSTLAGPEAQAIIRRTVSQR